MAGMFTPVAKIIRVVAGIVCAVAGIVCTKNLFELIQIGANYSRHWLELLPPRRELFPAWAQIMARSIEVVNFVFSSSRVVKTVHLNLHTGTYTIYPSRDLGYEFLILSSRVEPVGSMVNIVFTSCVRSFDAFVPMNRCYFLVLK